MGRWHIDLIQQAWLLAASAHDGQKYAGPGPEEYFDYLTHLGGVMLEVMQALPHHPEANADLVIACAILHDTVEDTKVTQETISEIFGPNIAAGVAALTKNESLGSKQVQMLDSLHRIKQQPPEIWMVKMADRIMNLSPPPFHWKREKVAAYNQEAQLIYDHLHPASQYLAGRLQQKIENYRQFY